MSKARIGYAVTFVVRLFAGIAIGRAQTRRQPPLQPAMTPMTQRTYLDS